jgi:hypothetical protein
MLNYKQKNLKNLKCCHDCETFSSGHALSTDRETSTWPNKNTFFDKKKWQKNLPCPMSIKNKISNKLRLRFKQ